MSIIGASALFTGVSTGRSTQTTNETFCNERSRKSIVRIFDCIGANEYIFFNYAYCTVEVEPKGVGSCKLSCVDAVCHHRYLCPGF